MKSLGDRIEEIFQSHFDCCGGDYCRTNPTMTQEQAKHALLEAVKDELPEKIQFTPSDEPYYGEVAFMDGYNAAISAMLEGLENKDSPPSSA